MFSEHIFHTRTIDTEYEDKWNTTLTSYGPYCGVTPSERDESEKLQYILHWLVFSVSSIWEGNKATETWL